jgi:hypothetical protein
MTMGEVGHQPYALVAWRWPMVPSAFHIPNQVRLARKSDQTRPLAALDLVYPYSIRN